MRLARQCSWFVVSSLIGAFLGGCGPTNAPSGGATNGTSPPPPPGAARTAVSPPAPGGAVTAGPSTGPSLIPQNPDDGPLPADRFDSVEAAITAMKEYIDKNETNRMARVGEWLATHRAVEAVAPLAALLNDGEAPEPQRLAATVALGKLGRPAFEALLAAGGSDAPQRVRLNAIKQLAMIKPLPAEAYERLVGWSGKDESVPIRVIAIQTLKAMGTQAGAAGPMLQEMLNNTSEDEQVRAAAQDALKAVNPRRTFVD